MKVVNESSILISQVALYVHVSGKGAFQILRQWITYCCVHKVLMEYLHDPNKSSESLLQHLFLICGSCHAFLVNQSKPLLVTVKPITAKIYPPCFVVSHFIFILGWDEENRTVAIIISFCYTVWIKMKCSVAKCVCFYTRCFTQGPTITWY